MKTAWVWIFCVLLDILLSTLSGLHCVFTFNTLKLIVTFPKGLSDLVWR